MLHAMRRKCEAGKFIALGDSEIRHTAQFGVNRVIKRFVGQHCGRAG